MNETLIMVLIDCRSEIRFILFTLFIHKLIFVDFTDLNLFQSLFYQSIIVIHTFRADPNLFIVFKKLDIQSLNLLPIIHTLPNNLKFLHPVSSMYSILNLSKSGFHCLRKFSCNIFYQ